ncbi:haloacid dehalogenase [Mycobacterium sp. pUA109]|uniref:HAD hydrolase-like protein n=1 Tax=Mycobacterium sp. pUA109 TaxID=3238982 RepID=UPI00351B1C2D
MYLTSRRTRPARTFWWDRARPLDADLSPLRAVIFDAEALGELDHDGDRMPRSGLADLVMSLFVAGVWVAVISTDARDVAQTQARQLLGEGLAETIVSADDLPQPASTAELYRLALWELGIGAASALAVVGSTRGLRAAAAAELGTVVVTGAGSAHPGFPGAVQVRAGYDGLLVDGCRELCRRWGVAQLSCRAAS